MKQILVIGSTAVDIIIRLPHLPATCEDVHVITQSMSLGGCAYNTSDTIRHFQVPYTLFTPVGTGTYGNFVRDAFAQRGITTPIPTPDQENGCCYCFVENNGERTFLSYHGAEYLFQPEWFDLLDTDSIDSVYICGLEIEETTGIHIIEFLEKHPSYRILFAPGPRIQVIPSEKMNRVLALSPILHLNETEALTHTGEKTIEAAARSLYAKTRNTVIITLGDKGTYYYTDHETGFVPAYKASQIDTIGAGDSHAGAILARLQQGASIREAIADANKVSAAVVETPGALLPDEKFQTLALPLGDLSIS